MAGDHRRPHPTESAGHDEKNSDGRNPARRIPFHPARRSLNFASISGAASGSLPPAEASDDSNGLSPSDGGPVLHKKRDFGGSNAGGSNSPDRVIKKSRGPGTGMTEQRDVHGTMKIHVPSNRVGALMGPGGATIKKVESMSGAIISMNKAHQNLETTEFLVSGKQKEISAAERIMKTVVKRGSHVLKNMDGDHMLLEFPSVAVGLIMGKAAKNILTVKKESGASIDVVPNTSASSEQTLMISGTNEQRTKAKTLLNQMVSPKGFVLKDITQEFSGLEQPVGGMEEDQLHPLYLPSGNKESQLHKDNGS